MSEQKETNNRIGGIKGEVVIDEAHLMLLGEEIHVMKHALGWPKLYRNHYCAEPNSYQCGIWESLTKRGLAMEAQGVRDNDAYPMRTFAVTDLGTKALAHAVMVNAGLLLEEHDKFMKGNIK